MLIKDNGSNEKLKRSIRLDEHRVMKIHSRDIQVVTRAVVPRSLPRSKTYRNLVGQWFLGPCGSNEYYNDSIVEEDEEIEMLEGGPSNQLDGSILSVVEHRHAPEPARLEILRATAELRNRAEKTAKTLRAIVAASVSGLPVSTAGQLPNHRNLNRIVNRTGKFEAPFHVFPTDFKHFIEPQQYEISDYVNQFLKKEVKIESESPARPSSSTNHDINGQDWRAEDNDDSSDKEDDDEVEEANLRSSQVEEPIPSNPNVSSSILEPPEIKVTVDESLHQMAHEYRENFDGFAEINRFENIEEMHEFIKNTLDSSPPAPSTPSNQQERYLDLLLNEKPSDRFRRLFETSRVTVRRVLSRNEDILSDLFSSATIDNFPSPLAPIDEYEAPIDDEDGYDNSRDLEVEENMKRWYMIEMIGLWLKLITDVKSYREAIKKKILMKSWGIENDRYDGIAVPLKYK